MSDWNGRALSPCSSGSSRSLLGSPGEESFAASVGGAGLSAATKPERSESPEFSAGSLEGSFGSFGPLASALISMSVGSGSVRVRDGVVKGSS